MDEIQIWFGVKLMLPIRPSIRFHKNLDPLLPQVGGKGLLGFIKWKAVGNEVGHGQAYPFVALEEMIGTGIFKAVKYPASDEEDFLGADIAMRVDAANAAIHEAPHFADPAAPADQLVEIGMGDRNPVT